MNKIYIEKKKINIWYFLKTKTLICLDIPREELWRTIFMRLFEDIKFTDEQLQPTEVDWCKSNTEFSPVITKFNKQKQWTAISIRGYVMI